METAAFSFATDFRDEGVEEVLDNIQERAGLGGVTLAAVYHHGRDIFPHSPVRKVRFLEGGAAFFRPDPSRYEGGIEPHVSSLAREEDILERVVEAAAGREMRVNAWTVYLHNSTLGMRYPDCAPRNAFGDPYLTDLCPANPDVRAYVRSLTGDIASRGVATIVAESLHYHPLEHGFHHERYFLELGSLDRYLLGLCFCEHCKRAAADAGTDADRVQAEARARLERVFAGGEPTEGEAERPTLEELAGGEMAGYLEARDRVVASLVEEAGDAARREGADLTFMDLSGAVKGYATGRPTGGPASEISWRLGVDLETIGGVTHLQAIGYAADPSRLKTDLEAYRSHLSGEHTLSVALRPMPPDCRDPDNLAEKLKIAQGLGIARTDFYHYGFVPLPVLDRVRTALEQI